jgi:hypothetical protein
MTSKTMKRHLFALFAAAAAVFAQTPASFTNTGSMTTARAWHTATLLNNGKVLIVGGSGDASAELYDPVTGTFTPTGNTIEVQNQQTATLLPNGRVLLAGSAQNGTAQIPEIYDPVSGTFNQTGNMTSSDYGFFGTKAVLLPSGLVLVAGVSGADLYDPSTGIFSSAGAYASPGHDYISTATLLSNGTVLLTGGARLWGELYDPIANTFSVTDFNSLDLQKATLLETGRVLFEAGDCDPDDRAELYDPMTGIFDLTGQLVAWRRFTSTATLLTDGRVLVAGSDIGGTADASAELYDPSSGTFSATPSMNVPRSLHAATLLIDGTVLITGGFSPTDSASVASAEIYHPTSVTPPPVLLSVGNNGQAAVLHGASQQIVSEQNPAQAGEAVEVYLTGLVDGNTIPPRISVGGKLAQVLFFGDAPGYSGLNQVNIVVPPGIPSGQATILLNYMGRPSNQVYLSIQ